MSSKRIALFPQKQEATILGFTIMAVLITFIAILANFQLSKDSIHLGHLVSRTLFLNHIHVYFTFLMLQYLPEFVVWRKEKVIRNHLFLFRFAAVILIVFSLVMLFQFKVAPDSRLFSTALLWLVLIVNYHHVIGQNFGLFMLYNRMAEKNSNFSEVEKLKARRLEKLERLLARTNWTLTLFAIPLFNSEQIFSVPILVRSLYLSFHILIAITLILLTLFFPSARESNKTIYSFQFILFPLIPLSYLALLGLFSIHGLEYLFVCQKLTRHSSLSEERIRYLRPRVLAVILVCALLGLSEQGVFGWWLAPHFPDYKLLISIAAGLTGGVVYLHFYVDSLLFKRSDPLSRQFIFPLLIGPKSPSSGPS